MPTSPDPFYPRHDAPLEQGGRGGRKTALGVLDNEGGISLSPTPDFNPLRRDEIPEPEEPDTYIDTFIKLIGNTPKVSAFRSSGLHHSFLDRVVTQSLASTIHATFDLLLAQRPKSIWIHWRSRASWKLPDYLDAVSYVGECLEELAHRRMRLPWTSPSQNLTLGWSEIQVSNVATASYELIANTLGPRMARPFTVVGALSAQIVFPRMDQAHFVERCVVGWEPIALPLPTPTALPVDTSRDVSVVVLHPSGLSKSIVALLDSAPDGDGRRYLWVLDAMSLLDPGIDEPFSSKHELVCTFIIALLSLPMPFLI